MFTGVKRIMFIPTKYIAYSMYSLTQIISQLRELRASVVKLKKMLTGCKGFQRSATGLANLCYLIYSQCDSYKMWDIGALALDVGW